MACFLVPAGEAIVVTAVSKVAQRHAKKHGKDIKKSGSTTMNSLLEKRKWLTNLLWGGSALLAFEHLWHGEIIPWFPFLTAAFNSEDTMSMLKEMSTVGVGMALIVTIVWIGMVFVSNAITKRSTSSMQDMENHL